MAKRQSKKAGNGERNASRRNGKAWKNGESPEVREANRKAKVTAKRERKQAA